MDGGLFLSFLVVSFGLIVIPGPNILVIVSTSLQCGKTRGLQTVVGTSLAMCFQLFAAGVGTTWFVGFLNEGFFILKWVGIIYLFSLGFLCLFRALIKPDNQTKLGGTATFSRGFFVSLSNPKTILFFSAFIPQFIMPTQSYWPQLVMLSLSFLVMAIIVDTCYAIFSARVQSLFKLNNLYRMQNGSAGFLFLVASFWLALSYQRD